MTDLARQIEELSPERRRLLEEALAQEGFDLANLAHSPDEGNVYTAPRTPREELLARLWAEALGLERVGIQDDFFKIGGDSIHAIQLVGRARRQGLVFTSPELFEHPTVEALAKIAREVTPHVDDEAEAQTGAEIPLAPIQRWLFELGLPRPGHWNQAILLAVDPEVDPAHVARAWDHVTRHHDILRLRFHGDVTAPRGRMASPDTHQQLFRLDLSRLAAARHRAVLEEVCGRIQGGFDLEKGPLVTAAWFHLGEGLPARFLLVAHHLLVDGVSFRILLEDLERVRLQLARGEATPVSLPPKTASFKRWAESLSEIASDPERSEKLARQLEAGFGKDSEDTLPLDTLPLDHPGGQSTEASAREVSLLFDRDESRAIIRQIPALSRTGAQEVLLSALLLALTGFTGRRRLRIDMEGHGREDLATALGGAESPDVTRTVGWFTSLYTVAFDLGPEGDSPLTVLRRVRQQLRDVPGRGLAQGLLRYMGPEPLRRRLSFLPAAEVMFNYLGHFDGVLPADSPWSPAAESCGSLFGPSGRRPHVFQVVAEVVDARLRLRIIYSSDLHRPSTVERLAARLRQELLRLRALCEEETRFVLEPADFPAAGLDDGPDGQEELRRILSSGSRVEPEEVEDVLTLTPVQEGMLFHVLGEGSDPSLYREQGMATLRGPLDEAAFQRAWQAVVERHPALRTSFCWEGLRRPRQRIHRHVELPFASVDLRSSEAEEAERRITALLEEDRHKLAELGSPPLMRITLVRTEEACHRLLWSIHHLVHDAWSLSILLEEVLVLYRAQGSGDEALLAPVPVYGDYVRWLAAGKASEEEAGEKEAFWRRTLRGFVEPTPLPAGAASVESLHGPALHDRRDRRLPAPVSSRFEAACRERGLTLAAVIHGIWSLVLGGAEGREALFGTVMAGRPQTLPGAERMVGLFINTLPLRVRLDPGRTFQDWLAELQAQLRQLQHHEQTPLAKIQGWSDIDRATPLFESIVVVQNVFVGVDGREQDGLVVEDVSAVGHPNYPLMFRVTPGTRLWLEVLFDSRRLSAARADAILDDAVALVEAFEEQPELTLAQLRRRLSQRRREARSATARQRRQAGLTGMRAVKPSGVVAAAPVNRDR